MDYDLTYDLTSGVIYDHTGNKVTHLEVARTDNPEWHITVVPALAGVHVEMDAKQEDHLDTAPLLTGGAETDGLGETTIRPVTQTDELDALLGVNTGSARSLLNMTAQFWALVDGQRKVSQQIRLTYRHDVTQPSHTIGSGTAYPPAQLVWDIVNGNFEFVVPVAGPDKVGGVRIQDNSSFAVGSDGTLALKLVAGGGIVATADGRLQADWSAAPQATDTQPGVIRLDGMFMTQVSGILTPDWSHAPLASPSLLGLIQVDGTSIRITDGRAGVNWANMPQASATTLGASYAALTYGASYSNAHHVTIGYLKDWQTDFEAQYLLLQGTATGSITIPSQYHFYLYGGMTIGDNATNAYSRVNFTYCRVQVGSDVSNPYNTEFFVGPYTIFRRLSPRDFALMVDNDFATIRDVKLMTAQSDIDHITGDLTVDDDLTVGGISYLGESRVSGPLTVGGTTQLADCTVTGKARMQDAEVGGDLAVTGHAQLDDATIGGQLLRLGSQDLPAGWYGSGEYDHHYLTLQDIREISPLTGSPVGTILAWPGGTAPEGWMLCYGYALDRIVYADLYAVIGLTYGSDGSSTFRLPDMRGYFVRGHDGGAGIDSGRVLGSKQTDAIRNITGGLGWIGSAIGAAESSATSALYWSNAGSYGARNDIAGTSRQDITFNASRSVPTASENRPKNIALNYIIKYAI